MKKRFIEWDLPLAEISDKSSKERKMKQGNPSTLHIWWARRPLAASRATNFAALIDLPEDKEKRREITSIVEKISPWEEIKKGKGEWLKKAQNLIKNQWKEPPKIIDIFGGGGAIPLEAFRLGCEIYANDLNPISVMLQKATLEYPNTYGKKKVTTRFFGEKEINPLFKDIQKWGKWVSSKTQEEIGKFYPSEEDGAKQVSYIWVKTIKCQNPNCGYEIPLIGTFWLVDKKNRKIAIKPIIDTNNSRIIFSILEGKNIDFDPDKGTISRGNALCLKCKQVTKLNEITKLNLDGNIIDKLIAVVIDDTKSAGKRYRMAEQKDENVIKKVEKYLKEKVENWPYIENPIPDEQTPDGKGKGAERAFSIRNYGLNTWGDLFNSRQKLTIISLIEIVKKSYEKMIEEGIDQEYAKAIVSYLGLSIDNYAEKNNRLNRWVNNVESIAGCFAMQALPMRFEYAEGNPFYGSISFERLINFKIGGMLGWLVRCEGKFGRITQTTSTKLPYPDEFFDAVLTDPPYYDNIPYSYLSDFFYVWLKRCIGEIHPDLFALPLTPKQDEIVAYTINQSWDEAKSYFEKMLGNSFREIYRILKPDGITIIIYAHKTTEGWETMLNSLIDAKLVVTASWPLHTEMKDRLRAAASAALASSIYMVCRKAERKKVGFYSEIQPQIKERIEEKLQQFWDEGIAGGDFFISAIGPGMEIFSQYERVEKLSGEQVKTAELLDYIRSISTDFIVAKLLKDASSANIDRESDFYLAYRWTYLDNTVEYDDARKLANASGINLEDLWGPGGFIKKSGSTICVLGPKERGDIESIKNMVDVMHKTLLLWERGKKDEIAELLTKTGFGSNPAFKQFCQAVAESLLNGNKEKQLLEGFLLGIDDYARVEVKTKKFQTDLKQYGVR